MEMAAPPYTRIQTGTGDLEARVPVLQMRYTAANGPTALYEY